MAITNLPTPPSRSNTPANFIINADAFIAALPVFVTEANAQAAALTLNATNDTSASSVLIGTGSKTFTVSASKSFQPGMYLVIASTAAPSTNSMNVQVTSYSGTTLIVNSISVTGSGTIASWTISQSVNFIPFDGSITTAKLADLSVTTAKLADLSVTTAKLAGSAKTNKIQPITATVASDALTLTLNPTTLDFRATTLGSGTVTTISNAVAISMIVPSGTLLGHTNAVLGRDIVLAINNAGTMEVAVNFSGSGVNLDETGVITTEAITVGCTFTGAIAVTTGILTLTTGLTGALTLKQSLSGANVNSGTYVIALLTGVLGANGSTYSTNQTTAAASTTITGSAGYGVYSTTARTGVAYRVAGYVESTQATAGTWATAPSLIQGAGGQAAVPIALNAGGSAPIYVCRAWVNFNGTTGAIRASGNVSSVTRNALGDYTINFSVAMPDINYVVNATGDMLVVATSQSPVMLINNSVASPLTINSVRVVGKASSTTGLYEVNYGMVSIFR